MPLVETSKVFVGLASMPARVDSLKQVVAALLPQCGKLGVYLNGYTKVPDFLDHPSIVVARSQDHGDQKDNGKFFFLDSSRLKYYATVDDDIQYPALYISRMLRHLALVGQNDVVGAHGFLLPEEVTSITSNRHAFHFGEAAAFLSPANVLGTGTVMFNLAKWKLKFDEFGQPGMSDIWFAIAAKRRDATLWIVPRPKSWLTAIAQPNTLQGEKPLTLFDESNADDHYQVELLHEAGVKGSWTVYLDQLFEASIARENFCLTQGMQISNIATELHWAAPDVAHRARLGKINHKEKESLLHDSGLNLGNRFSSRWMQNYARTALDFASGDVSDPDSLDFVAQLPFMLSQIGDAPVPNCLMWDARPDRQEQLAEFILQMYAASLTSGRTHRTTHVEDKLLSRLTYEQMIEMAAKGSRSEILLHPDMVKLLAAKPESALELIYRYLTALQDLADADIPTLPEWRELFAGHKNLQTVLIVYAYLQSRIGNQDLARQILQELNSKSGLGMETYLLGLRLATMKSGGAVAIAQNLGKLLELFGFESKSAPTKKQPKVSVVLTTFNQADEIIPTLENILSSTYPNIEVIIVDDASTDESRSVLSTLKYSNVKVILQEHNTGPYGSRNTALKRAKGEFIAFHDCGDYALPERLSVQVERLVANPELQCVRSQHLRIDHSATIGLENNLKFLGDAPVTMVVRKGVFDQVGPFLPTRTRGDIEFLRRLGSFFGSAKLEVVKFPFYLAGPPVNSIKFSNSVVRDFLRRAFDWHRQLESNKSLADPWALDGLVPFDVPQEISVKAL